MRLPFEMYTCRYHISQLEILFDIILLDDMYYKDNYLYFFIKKSNYEATIEKVPDNQASRSHSIGPLHEQCKLRWLTI